MAFVTNQKVTEGERKELEALASPTPVEIFHFDRVAGVLDKPSMVSVRKQFLQIDTSEAAVLGSWHQDMVHFGRRSSPSGR
jgi:hypothetical protein